MPGSFYVSDRPTYILILLLSVDVRWASVLLVYLHHVVAGRTVLGAHCFGLVKAFRDKYFERMYSSRRRYWRKVADTHRPRLCMLSILQHTAHIKDDPPGLKEWFPIRFKSASTEAADNCNGCAIDLRTFRLKTSASFSKLASGCVPIRRAIRRTGHMGAVAALQHLHIPSLYWSVCDRGRISCRHASPSSPMDNDASIHRKPSSPPTRKRKKNTTTAAHAIPNSCG